MPIDYKAVVYHVEIETENSKIIAIVREIEQATRIFRNATAAGHGTFLGSRDASQSDLYKFNIGNLLPLQFVKINIFYAVELVLLSPTLLRLSIPLGLFDRYSPHSLSPFFQSPLSSLPSPSLSITNINHIPIYISLSLRFSVPVRSISSSTLSPFKLSRPPSPPSDHNPTSPPSSDPISITSPLSAQINSFFPVGPESTPFPSPDSSSIPIFPSTSSSLTSFSSWSGWAGEIEGGRVGAYSLEIQFQSPMTSHLLLSDPRFPSPISPPVPSSPSSSSDSPLSSSISSIPPWFDLSEAGKGVREFERTLPSQGPQTGQTLTDHDPRTTKREELKREELKREGSVGVGVSFIPILPSSSSPFPQTPSLTKLPSPSSSPSSSSLKHGRFVFLLDQSGSMSTRAQPSLPQPQPAPPSVNIPSSPPSPSSSHPLWDSFLSLSFVRFFSLLFRSEGKWRWVPSFPDPGSGSDSVSLLKGGFHWTSTLTRRGLSLSSLRTAISLLPTHSEVQIYGFGSTFQPYFRVRKDSNEKERGGLRSRLDSEGEVVEEEMDGGLLRLTEKRRKELLAALIPSSLSSNLGRLQQDLGGTEMTQVLKFLLSSLPRSSPTTTLLHSSLNSSTLHPNGSSSSLSPSTLPLYIIMLTDGEVTNPLEISSLSRSLLSLCGARVFVLGVGSSASLSLVRAVAEAGGGDWDVLEDSDLVPSELRDVSRTMNHHGLEMKGGVEEKVIRLLNKLSSPSLSDIKVKISSPPWSISLQSPLTPPPSLNASLSSLYLLLSSSSTSTDSFLHPPSIEVVGTVRSSPLRPFQSTSLSSSHSESFTSLPSDGSLSPYRQVISRSVLVPAHPLSALLASPLIRELEGRVDEISRIQSMEKETERGNRGVSLNQTTNNIKNINNRTSNISSYLLLDRWEVEKSLLRSQAISLSLSSSVLSRWTAHIGVEIRSKKGSEEEEPIKGEGDKEGQDPTSEERVNSGTGKKTDLHDDDDDYWTFNDQAFLDQTSGLSANRHRTTRISKTRINLKSRKKSSNHPHQSMTSVSVNQLPLKMTNNIDSWEEEGLLFLLILLSLFCLFLFWRWRRGRTESKFE